MSSVSAGTQHDVEHVKMRRLQKSAQRQCGHRRIVGHVLESWRSNDPWTMQSGPDLMAVQGRRSSRLGLVDVHAAEEPEHDKNDQYQAESAANSRCTIPVVP